jgi:uncharacterized protein (TIGR03032 family)
MPHSPRWHQGNLWLLESGTGTIGTVDLGVGRYVPIAELPGFTRGLDFCGNLAFIGLSQVRDLNLVNPQALAVPPSCTLAVSRAKEWGIPLTERLTERTCGVWVVDLTTGRTVAFLKFQDAVQEIFAVQVLPRARFPDLINDDPKILANSFVLPDDALRQLPDALREPSRPDSEAELLPVAP